MKLSDLSLLAEGDVNVHGYHATIIDHLDSIFEKGLIPGASKPTGQNWLGEYSGKGIYFHVAPAWDTHLLPNHELMSDNGEPITVLIEFKIPASYHQLVHDEEGGYDNEPEDIEQTIEDGGAMVYKGRIQVSALKALYISNKCKQHYADDLHRRYHVPVHRVDGD